MKRCLRYTFALLLLAATTGCVVAPIGDPYYGYPSPGAYYGPYYGPAYGPAYYAAPAVSIGVGGYYGGHYYHGGHHHWR